VHHHGPTGSSASDRRALAGALALVVAFVAVEVAAGFAADSLALLADAGHMLTDSFALGLALFASWAAGRPRTPARSFGYQRAEILAALTNAVLLVAIAIWIFVEAYGRLRDPPDVLAGWVLAVGALGIAVNLGAAGLLTRATGESLNRRAALRHVLADLLGSVGVVLAGALVLTTGWREADPLVSVLIGVLVLASSWAILRESVGILLEATPRGVDAEEVGRTMAAVGGVQEVHDLHIWTITSGFPSLSAHVLVAPGADCHGIRLELERLLRERFGLTHTTLQVEHAAPQRIELRRGVRTGR
jgi:cobalt-zinc-cadmium efflux system protein